VVVVRNHVLSVEAGGEGAAAAIARAMELRQWASLTRRRRGVAGLARDEDLTRTVVETVAKAGYAGVVLGRAHRHGRAEMRELIRMADEQGIVILERASEAGAAS
jgi:lipid-A-disaccharide synthase